MLTLSVGELKANFSEVLKKVSAGEEVAIAYGKKKGIVAKIIPNIQKKSRRKLGILEGKATARFAEDYKMTDEEFLGL